MSNQTSREDFIKSIKSDMFKEMVDIYFDESMALYDLIADRIEVDCIYADKEDNSIGIVFSIEAETEQDASNIENTIKSHTVSCYTRNYSVETEVNKTRLHIKFKEEVSG